MNAAAASHPGSVTKARTCKHNVWTGYVDGNCGCLHLSRSQLDTQRGFVFFFVFCVSRRAFFLKNDFRKNKNGSTTCEDSASNPFFHYCAILFGSRCDSADLLRLGVVRLCGVSYGNWVAGETRSRKTFPHLSHS